MRLHCEFILLSGSASRTCAAATLSKAHDTVRALVSTILQEGGGLIVFAGDEPMLPSGLALPLVFDWTVLRATEAFLARQAVDASVGPHVVVVTSNKAMTRKMSEENRQLLGRLSTRKAVDFVYIDDDLHTGGNIRDAQIERAGAMVALGGGKGVVGHADKLIRRGKPVFPLDIAIGALSEDGDGARALHRRLLADTKVFFPQTHASVSRQIPALSLEVCSADPAAVARGIVEIIAAERAAATLAGPEIAILTALPVELAAVKAVLGQPESDSPEALDSGTQYWRSALRSLSGEVRGVVLSCIGTAGNVDAAAAVTEIIGAFRPRLLIMVGIAAGMRGKLRLGEVVLSERIVAYESAALVASPTSVERRPDQFRPDHWTQQLMVSYLAGGQPLRERLGAKMAASGLSPPEDASKEDFADGLPVRSATLASGEKLLRDPERLRVMRATLHGKIEVAEMEATGIAVACGRASTSYLVVRGISDFGDAAKNDGAHPIAATAAAIVAIDFIEHAYRRAP